MIFVVAIPLLITSTINFIMSSTTASDTVENMNAVQARMLAHDFRAVIDNNINVLNTIATSVSARKVLKGELDKESVAEWVKKTDDAIGDGNVCIFANAEGMQIIRNVGDCVDIKDRDYYQSMVKTNSVAISNQNISKTTKKRIITIIVPIFDKDGTRLGSVQRNYNLTNLTELAKSEVTENNMDVFIADTNGDILGHSTLDLETGEPLNQSDQRWYKDSRGADESGYYTSVFRGIKFKTSWIRDSLTGFVTVVARDESVAMATANQTLLIIVTLGIIILVVTSLLAFKLSKSFTDPISSIDESITKLVQGEFMEITKHTDRKDEFGEIINSMNDLIKHLHTIISRVQSAVSTVSSSSEDLATTASQINDTTDGVSQAVEDIARGATDQANNIQTATENIATLTDAIQDVTENAATLSAESLTMSNNSKQSAEALQQLTKHMESMTEAVTSISEAMTLTNAAVQAVNTKVDGITSIASQTNLLALNASIEAARAGEAGRGFAVVAEEIGKLSNDSAVTAEEIRSEMKNLLEHSNSATNVTQDVSIVMDSVTDILQQTTQTVNNLIENVNISITGIDSISKSSKECDEAKNQIVDAMSSLSAISEENAASTEETSASMEELNATINMLNGSAGELNNIAQELQKEISFFKL